MNAATNPMNWFKVLTIVVASATAGGCREPKVGAVLTYEVATEKSPGDAPEDVMPELLMVVEKRVGDDGKVRQLSGDRIAIDVYGEGDLQQLEKLRRRIEVMGVLEFRIMASRKIAKHQTIIELAEKLPADGGTEVGEDRVVARWIDCDTQEFPNGKAIDDRGIVWRESNGVLQALALTDDGINVNGVHLQSIGASLDETGRPQLDFVLNAAGAKLFGKLTGDHMPTATGARYNLGICYDGRLLSAPSIESKITKRCRVSGNMRQNELDFLTAILNAGQLPCQIVEVAAVSAP